MATVAGLTQRTANYLNKRYGLGIPNPAPFVLFRNRPSDPRNAGASAVTEGVIGGYTAKNPWIEVYDKGSQIGLEKAARTGEYSGSGGARSLQLLLHELMHTSGPPLANWDRWAEEGLAERVAADLGYEVADRFLDPREEPYEDGSVAMLERDHFQPQAYFDRVADIDRLSIEATRDADPTGWRQGNPAQSDAARQWRIMLMAASAQRRREAIQRAREKAVRRHTASDPRAPSIIPGGPNALRAEPRSRPKGRKASPIPKGALNRRGLSPQVRAERRRRGAATGPKPRPSKIPRGGLAPKPSPQVLRSRKKPKPKRPADDLKKFYRRKNRPNPPSKKNASDLKKFF